jgi:glutaredoxin
MARRVTLFTRDGCHLCESALHVIRTVQARDAFELEIIDIDAAGQQAWRAAYDHHVPVVHLDGREIARHRVTTEQLEEALRAP